MANKLIFKNAEAVKSAIMDSQKKEIAALYKDWADEIGERAKYYSHKSTASSAVSERQMRELQNMLKTTGQQVSDEIYNNIKGNLYTIADAVVKDNVEWLKSFGFSESGLNAAFNYVPNEVVQNLITGQIYESGWSLSKRIWGDNEQTMKDAYSIMARGLAENKPVYAIAKDLEQYVRPGAKKSWNPVLAMKNTKTGKVEYKRIYKGQVDYNAQRLARTLAQHSYQQSFVATTQKNPFITEYIWRSNGSRVCPLCSSRDGVHFKKDDLPLDHPNGMCTIEPVIIDDMTDQLANWFNSPDGTYPEIDNFASNFGYQAKAVKTNQDFVNKYGTSAKSLNAWYNSLNQIQKAEAKLLKNQSGLTWNKWYEQNIYDTGDETQNFVKKYGTSTKSLNAWYNSLSIEQKAEAKALKIKSGLTWNEWYNKNIYKGTGSAPATTTTKAFSSMQNKYLSPYGFTTDNMPKSFDDWSHKVSFDQASEILNSMGTSWSDPHPYQQLMKYYNANLTSSNFVSQSAAKATTATATKGTKALTENDIVKMLKSGNSNDFSVVEKLFAKHGFNIEDFFDDDEVFQQDSGLFKTAVNKVLGNNTTSAAANKVTTNTTSTFGVEAWKESVRKNNLNEMNRWTDNWLKTITATEKKGVVTYTSNAYQDMNSYLRGFSKTTRYKSEIKACQQALSKASLPQETIVRRGSGYNMLDELGIGRITPENKSSFIGAIVQDKGFVSTSPSPNGGFSGSIEYVIKLPQGSQAMYVDSISRFQGEQELLINCGGKYMVEEVEFDSYGDVKKIYMALVNLKN